VLFRLRERKSTDTGCTTATDDEFHPDGTVYGCPSCVSTDICASGRRNVELLRSSQVSDLFAVYTGLKLISLLPHTSMLTGVAIDIVSIFSFQNEVLTRFYGKDVWLINEQTVNEVRF
jgi:hypothetical protein